MDIKNECNRDFRETAAYRPPPSKSSPDGKAKQDIRQKDSQQKKTPILLTQAAFNSPQVSLNPVISDIRFQNRPSVSSQTKNKPSQSRFNFNHSRTSNYHNKENPKTNQNIPSRDSHNRGKPRTYLSDRVSRNVDVRETSSFESPPVSYGYQYPSVFNQSKGPYRKYKDWSPNPDKKAEVKTKESK